MSFSDMSDEKLYYCVHCGEESNQCVQWFCQGCTEVLADCDTKEKKATWFEADGGSCDVYYCPACEKKYFEEHPTEERMKPLR